MQRSDILDAWVFLRKKNHSIPDDALDLIKGASLKAYDEMMDVKSDQQNESLLAQVEELKDFLKSAFSGNGLATTGRMEKLIAETPQQSLDSLKARTISSLLDSLKDYLEEPEWNHLEHSVREIMK